MESGSLFHITHHCRIRDFRRFVNISHIVTGHIFTELGEATDTDKGMNHR